MNELMHEEFMMKKQTETEISHKCMRLPSVDPSGNTIHVFFFFFNWAQSLSIEINQFLVEGQQWATVLFYEVPALSLRNVLRFACLTLLQLSVIFTTSQQKDNHLHFWDTTDDVVVVVALLIKLLLLLGRGNSTEESCSLAQTGRRAVCEINVAD